MHLSIYLPITHKLYLLIHLRLLGRRVKVGRIGNVDSRPHSGVLAVRQVALQKLESKL